MLVSALDSHPQIVCLGELFRRRILDRRGALQVLADIDEKFSDEVYRHTHQEAYLDAVFALHPDARFIGFKLMLPQNVELRDRLIADPAYRKILLYRDNILACYSSERIAKATGQGVAERDADVMTATIPFERKRFERYMQRRNALYDETRRLLGRCGSDVLEIEYRQAATGEGMKRVVGFIGASPEIPLEAGTKKRNPSVIVDRFTEPVEVAAYLRKAGLEAWAVEQLAGGTRQ